ncbi:hypothetical protein MANES_02G157450v8 [Manihot esculenta]|uniref:Uncharacterized protein n=1 Tax=Manihot esculenta TaxID=3983 RepID=A0ACB7I6Q3_MANES|nr:hypothetical protein MANES_02G157450v8 [Manihot esculenta]
MEVHVTVFLFLILLNTFLESKISPHFAYISTKELPIKTSSLYIFLTMAACSCSPNLNAFFSPQAFRTAHAVNSLGKNPSSNICENIPKASSSCPCWEKAAIIVVQQTTSLTAI